MEYIIFDHHKLGYLNLLEKINCLYCSYFNGLIAYVREIAGRTEQYWCPIRHSRNVKGMHTRYYQFADFGDAAAYRRKIDGIEKDLEDLVDKESHTLDKPDTH
jgi:hypothetical protein